ncbi:hypothetical protein [Zunongwangia profunda]|jgi:hypothetical protein|uniref:hypothetical protein n=1 Tax=Zunongwangia profunda TaxID=398743 RepID=UPI001D18CB82|nr:hypothetical protein [Zunongwangia profunda]MCC4230071.1 hypothetical protein [Zunongwangia profunda]|tara:strand:+ start:21338 stop:21799 length:462 start_codon:yes stop_codon:yes gene_type:complete
MKITVEPNSLYKVGDKIFGNIYFGDNEYVFPEKEWNDFVVIIFNWWSESILKLLKKVSIEEELDFMDGPASVKVQFLENNSFCLYFVLNNEVVNSIEVDVRLFTKEFLNTINLLIRTIKENKWADEEIDSLLENYKRLQKCFVEYLRNEKLTE